MKKNPEFYKNYSIIFINKIGEEKFSAHLAENSSPTKSYISSNSFPTIEMALQNLLIRIFEATTPGEKYNATISDWIKAKPLGAITSNTFTTLIPLRPAVIKLYETLCKIMPVEEEKYLPPI